MHRAVGKDSVRLARAEPLQFFVTGRGLVSGLADLGGKFSVGPPP
jgi:hypothetical protein